MNPLVRSLFHELSDLPSNDRENFYSDHQIEPGLRAEVESLLALDSANDHSFTESVSSEAADLLATGGRRNSTHWGPYRQIRLIGVGGMGSVYLAERTDGEIQQKVAVKLLRADSERPAWRERFLKE